MTYEQRLYNLIEEIKADKSFPNPWRNYVGSDGVRLQALIRMGESTTLREVPESPPRWTPGPGGMMVSNSNDSSDSACICVPGGVKQGCPKHGWTV
jgi:hypothetical protein